MRTKLGKELRIEIDWIGINEKILDKISIHDKGQVFGCCVTAVQNSDTVSLHSGISGSEYSWINIKKGDIPLFLNALNLARHVVVDDMMQGDETEKSIREEKAKNITFFIDALDFISKFWK